MPKQEQSIIVSGIDKENILAISYSAFKQLNWEIQFAGEEKLLAATPKSWKTNSQQIIVTASDGQLEVSSEMTQNESFDLGGKTKKNIAAFLSAFESCKTTVTEATLQANTDAINELRIKTMQVAEQEAKNAAEIDEAMNLSKGNLYFTYAIIAINVLVFILMVMDGAGIFEPNGYVHIKWGSDYTPLTLSGDWWRLITSVFLHFGIIHLLMNMYCLYMVGIYLEPMLGKVKYITAYLCTGVLANIVSLWWHTDGVNGAGASGAIFGMYGLFLALLTTNLIPKQMRQPLLQSIGIFVVYNLAYGMKGGVDNSAHIGGLLSGFVIGYIYAYAIKKEKQEQKIQWIIPAVILVTLTGAFGYLQQNKVDDNDRRIALNEVKEAVYKDNEKFYANYNEFIKLQKEAISIVYDSTLTNEVYLEQLNKTAKPQWEKAEVLIKETKTMDISDSMHKRADYALEYIELRKQEIEIRKARIGNDSDSLIIKQNEIVDKIDTVLDKLK